MMLLIGLFINLKQKKYHLVSIRTKLQNMKYEGSYLRAITFRKLEEFGFNRANDQGIRGYLYTEIHSMCDEHPMPIENSNDSNYNDNENEDHNDWESEDERYLCPLSGEVMENPVIAMDGNVYENQMIIDYLRQSGSFPNGEKCNVELEIHRLQPAIHVQQEIERKYGSQPPSPKRQRVGN